MVIDQCQQNNAISKDSAGGAIRTDDTSWNTEELDGVAGPEVSRMLTEFESVQTCSKTNDNRHLGVQKAFLKEVKSLVSV